MDRESNTTPDDNDGATTAPILESATARFEAEAWSRMKAAVSRVEAMVYLLWVATSSPDYEAFCQSTLHTYAGMLTDCSDGLHLALSGLPRSCEQEPAVQP